MRRTNSVNREIEIFLRVSIFFVRWRYLGSIQVDSVSG
ncbi:hypothetical protein LEP1GSC047_1824 [Leptospira inadai serovar Lyme str. 10]|uniref:Uncharacterized protein n=1 Tax=Leptospira inadai serovar Lyme str. 10 TaxID=1049790 RepID=V6H8A2_9LEPT|nr:hypothetical protein LEP1GSC047_1824 [Leptospira inadai serovar Lyme str. 10]